MGVIAKQSIRGTIVTYLGVAVGFVTTFFVLTRFLTAEEIGLARVLIDAATLFVSLAQLGTSSSIIRFYPYFREQEQRTKDKGQRTKDKYVSTADIDKGLPVLTPDACGEVGLQQKAKPTDHGFFFWTLVVPLVGFVLFALIYCACHVPLSQWFGEKSPEFVDYYYFVLPLAFFLLYQTIFETNANVRMRIVVPRAVRELVTRVGLLAVYLLYAFRVLSMDGFVMALCGVYALAALCNIVYLFSLGDISLRPDWSFVRTHRPLVRQYLYYTGFLIISALASALAPTLSSFFITAKMGLNYTGIYAIATYIAVMVSIPYRSMTAIAAPQLAASIKEQDRTQTAHLMQQVSQNLLLVGGFIFCLIWLNIDLIFHILPNGDTYATARMVVLILGVCQILIATFSFCLSAISYSRYYIFSLVLSFILTISAIALNNFLIPRYGMNGAAVSTLLSNALYFLLAVVVVRVALRIRLFSTRHLKTLLLLGAVLLSNYLWQRYLPLSNIWLSSIVRTLVLCGAASAAAWFGHLSPEINEQVKKYALRLRHK